VGIVIVRKPGLGGIRTLDLTLRRRSLCPC
jgi:hypothetical protein